MSLRKLLANIRFPAKANQLKKVRDMLRDTFQREGCSRGALECNCLILAIDEACNNIIEHAYGEKESGDIILDIALLDDELIIRITDFAKPVDCRAIKSRALDDIRPGGLGVYLMHKVMDEVHFLERPGGMGNVLEMKKKIKSDI